MDHKLDRQTGRALRLAVWMPDGALLGQYGVVRGGRAEIREVLGDDDATGEWISGSIGSKRRRECGRQRAGGRERGRAGGNKRGNSSTVCRGERRESYVDDLLLH